MVSGPSLEVIDAIRNAASLDQQIATLKQLKNDIVGHDQRKELLVKQGAVEPLVNILASTNKATGKRRAGNGEATEIATSLSNWTDEDEARLQATLILSSLASGGRAFVQPLLAAETVKHLLDALATERSPRVATATLQALRSLAIAASGDGDAREQIPLNIISSRDVTSTISHLLRQPSASPTGQHRLKLTLEILSLAANNETTRAELAKCGILDTLASLLASHAIATKQFDYRGIAFKHFSPAPPTAILPSIMSAIMSIITNSVYRVQSFILSPPIREVLSNAVPGDCAQPSYGARASYQNPVEHLLPQLHIPTYRSISFDRQSTAFPPLSSLQAADARVPGVTFDASQHGGDVEHANAVCGWLLVFARSMQGSSRLVSLRLLALVYNAIGSDSTLATPRSELLQLARHRDRQMAMLAIPLAAKLVQMAGEGANDYNNAESIAEVRESREIKENACEILALLIQSNRELQVAAVDAGATKRVCSLLKKSFDNVPIAKPMWSSKPTNSDQADAPESCKMGSRGLAPEIQHAMRCRQGALEALAALAAREDLHRKAIVEAGVVGCIIDSLKPFPPEANSMNSSAGCSTSKLSPKDGNTAPVILAACHAAQSLSRSVSLLRTSLIDGGIAKPIFDLLKHQSRDVQIAATDVCCNLLLEFSPMRDDLLAAGAIKTLAEHARGSEMDLRLASLWALKHLVHAATREVKVSCLEELGAGWLVGAIQGDQREGVLTNDGGGVSITGSSVVGGLSTPNAAGEQVDLLNPTSTSSMDVDDPPEHADEDEEDDDGEVMYDEASSTHYQASQLRSTLNHPLGTSLGRTSGSAFNSERYLSSVRETEQNPQLRAKRDDIAVQEQALDFVRNLLTGEDCAIMLDVIFEQIGVEKLFALLIEKLRPIPTSQLPSNTATRQQPVYQPTTLILSTIHVLTHIANGSPKHKQMFISMTYLLSAWLPHFNHADRRVRVISVWCVNSLTWIEDEHDRPMARSRADELRACGIEAAVRGLVADGDLDVRERVRTAVRQFEGL